MPDLITSAHLRNIAFSSIKDQVEKAKKSISKENKNGMIPYICISAMVIFYTDMSSIIIC